MSEYSCAWFTENAVANRISYKACDNVLRQTNSNGEVFGRDLTIKRDVLGYLKSQYYC